MRSSWKFVAVATLGAAVCAGMGQIPSQAAETRAAGHDSLDANGQVLSSPSLRRTDFKPVSVGSVQVVAEHDTVVVPQEHQTTAGVAADLVDWHEDDFAASWYDPDRRQVVLSYTTDTGRRLAEQVAESRDDLVVLEAKFSHAELMDNLRRLSVGNPTMKKYAQLLGVDAGGTGAYIESYEVPTTDELQGLSEVFDELGFPLRIEIVEEPLPDQPVIDDRRHDDSPYAGGWGYGIGRQTGGPPPQYAMPFFCTGGFGYVRNSTHQVLTAGHCYPRDSNNDLMFEISGPWADVNSSVDRLAGVWAGNGHTSWREDVGSVTVSDGDFHGDVSFVNVEDSGNAVNDRMWIGGPSTTSRNPVVSRQTPFVGLGVCRGGATSGDECGTLTVTAVNVDININDTGIWLRDADRARATEYICSEPGDSGGPVFRYYTGNTMEAVGIISGHTDYASGDCQQRFTGVEEAIQAWGGDLKLAP